MLPTSHRLRRSSDFAATVRRGSRARRGTLVVHQRDAASSDAAPATVGFVVSRAVGNSVVRHRVTRRLRHVVRERLLDLPNGSSTVVRALPASAGADSDRLAADFTAAIAALRRSRA